MLHSSLTSLDVRLAEMGMRLRFDELGGAFQGALVAAARGPFCLDDADVSAALAAFHWFLARASGEGIPLTSSGYMKPADVEAASAVVPSMADWIGKNNRESLAYPLLDFREALQRIKLLRKYKGHLMVTRPGKAALRNPQALWKAVATACVPAGQGFEAIASLLILVEVAAHPDGALNERRVVQYLNAMGWRDGAHEPLTTDALMGLPVFDVLANVVSVEVTGRAHNGRHAFGSEAAALARAALRNG
jgi:hypothetical protein